MYEVFEHTADLGLRVTAPSLDALFAESGKALFSVLVENLDAVRPRVPVELRVEGEELDFLLFDWLSELLYTFERDKLLLSKFQTHLAAGVLTARCLGEPMNEGRHHMCHEVKAITYHGLRVVQGSDGWLAEVILDI